MTPQKADTAISIKLGQILQDDLFMEKIQIGNLVDTRRMVVSFPDEKIKKMRSTLEHWHRNRRSFTLKQGAQLLGTLEHLASWCPWLRFTAFAIRDSFLTALRTNRKNTYEDKKMAYYITDSNTRVTIGIDYLKKNLQVANWRRIYGN